MMVLLPPAGSQPYILPRRHLRNRRADVANRCLDRPLDFNELLIENPAATFAVQIAGESMTGAWLFPGDIAAVDRARTAVDGSIVLALLAGEFTVKRYRKKGARTWLQARTRRLGTCGA
jgi:SOS-response transcriptional repressor LexA